jgi:hypothetical protein
VKEQNEKRRKRLRDEVFGLIAIAISLMAAVFTGLQYKEARATRIVVHEDASNARDDARKAAEAQVEDARRSAAAADRSAKAAEETAETESQALRVSQRPYIAIKDAKMWPVANGSTILMEFRIKAIGASPALNVHIHAKCIIYEHDEVEQKPSKEEEQEEDDLMGKYLNVLDSNGPSIMLPGVEETDRCSTYKLRSTSRFEEGGTLTVEGVIRYQDIFGKSHWTKFCYIDTTIMASDPQGILMQPCPSGNSAN